MKKITTVQMSVEMRNKLAIMKIEKGLGSIEEVIDDLINVMSWSKLKDAIAKKYDVEITDYNLTIEDEDYVVLKLENETINVAKDIRTADGESSRGYKLIGGK